MICDRAIRLCVDFRQLNDQTINDSYSLPRIEELFEGLADNMYFTVLDLKSGYHQLEIRVSQGAYSLHSWAADQIMNWPEPQNVGELRTYLGFASYHSKFERNSSKIAKPLNDLLGGKITKTKRKGNSKLKTNTDDMAKWKWG